MNKTANLILDDIDENYHGNFINIITCNIYLTELPGKNIFEKIAELQSTLIFLEENYKIVLANQEEIPIFIDKKYKTITFELDLSSYGNSDES